MRTQLGVKSSQVCEAHKCETKEENTKAWNPPQTNTKNQEVNLDKEMTTATQATGETHKKSKPLANTNPTENIFLSEKMAEADIYNKKQANTRKDHQPPPPPLGGTSKIMKDGAKPQTGVNKTPNPINVISNQTEEKGKSTYSATATKTRNPRGNQ